MSPITFLKRSEPCAASAGEKITAASTNAGTITMIPAIIINIRQPRRELTGLFFISEWQSHLWHIHTYRGITANRTLIFANAAADAAFAQHMRHLDRHRSIVRSPYCPFFKSNRLLRQRTHLLAHHTRLVIRPGNATVFINIGPTDHLQTFLLEFEQRDRLH